MALGLTFGEVRFLYVGVCDSAGNFAEDCACGWRWEKLCAQGPGARFTDADGAFEKTLSSIKYNTLAIGLLGAHIDAGVEVSCCIRDSAYIGTCIVYIASHTEGLRISDKCYTIIAIASQRVGNGRVRSSWVGWRAWGIGKVKSLLFISEFPLEKTILLTVSVISIISNSIGQLFAFEIAVATSFASDKCQRLT